MKSLHLRRIVFALFVIGILCRGQWLVEESFHSLSSSLSDIALSEIHGHSHPLGHSHSSDEDMPDLTHTLLHTLNVMDSYMPVIFLATFPNDVSAAHQSLAVQTPLEPHLPSLFRPPRIT